MTAQQVSDFSGRLEPAVTAAVQFKHAPFAPILMSLIGDGRYRRTGNPTVTWHEQSLRAHRTQINNGADDYDANTTSIVVDSAAGIRVGTLLKAEATGEVLFVSGVSGTTLTVQRGHGATSGAVASVADNAYLKVIGTAEGEGSGVPGYTVSEPDEVTNLIQTFKEPVKRTGLAMRTATLTEDESARLREVANRHFMRSQEWAIIHGVKGTATNAASETVRTLDGLVAMAQQVSAINGTLSFDALEAAVEPVFQVSDTNVLRAACGPTFMRTINAMARKDHAMMDMGQTEYGLRISVVHTSFGDLQLVPTWSLGDAYAGDAIVYDPMTTELRPTPRNPGAGEADTGRYGVMNGLMLPHLQINTQSPGEDAVEDCFFAEYSLQAQRYKIGHIQGVTGAAA